MSGTAFAYITMNAIKTTKDRIVFLFPCIRSKEFIFEVLESIMNLKDNGAVFEAGMVRVKVSKTMYQVAILMFHFISEIDRSFWSSVTCFQIS